VRAEPPMNLGRDEQSIVPQHEGDGDVAFRTVAHVFWRHVEAQGHAPEPHQPRKRPHQRATPTGDRVDGRLGALGFGRGRIQRETFSANLACGPSEEFARLAVDVDDDPRHQARIMSLLPVCPHLPAPRPGLDWRMLHGFRAQDRGAEFYVACLEYGHSLWQRGFAARAILCLDRAMGADLHGDEVALQKWPMPYTAMAWFITHTPEGVFIGNPRVHFQHYAGRMNEPRREQRRWRAWACWAIARAVRPDLPGDARHEIAEPGRGEIFAQLGQHGHPAEADLWLDVLGRAAAAGSAVEPK